MSDDQHSQITLEAYSIFENNLKYQGKSPLFKKKIKNCQFEYMSAVTNAIRQILSHRTVRGMDDIAKIQNLGQKQDLWQEHRSLKLSEFSQLLALRFIRETYFEANYFFMNYVLIQLSSILLAICLFRKGEDDDERGRFMFQGESKLFKDIDKQGEKELSKELEVIGFSIHKMALEILYTCGQYIRYYPFHQEILSPKDEQMQEKMENKLYKAYSKLIHEKVKFPKKFHYFKETDAQKYMAIYKKSNCLEFVGRKYQNMFMEIWKGIEKVLTPQSFQRPNLDNYLLFFQNELGIQIQSQLTFCKKIALQTFDRFFWKGLIEFTQMKLLEIKSFIEMESLTEQELKQILCTYLFILFFAYHLLEPEIMYLLEHQLIKELANLFLVVLKFYCKLSRQKQSNFKYSKSKGNIEIEGNLNALSSLKIILDCFRRIKQFSVEFTHQLHSRGNTVHNYPRITLYCDIILQIRLKKLSEPFLSSSKLQKEIIIKMQPNHELYFKKQQFLFIHYQKHNYLDHSGQIKDQFEIQIESIITQYSKYIQIERIVQIQPLVEYVDIQDEEVAKEQLQETNKTAKMDANLLKRLSYCLNMGGQSQEFIGGPHKMPEIKNAFKVVKVPSQGKVPSFLQSLKIGVNKPNEVLVKSLSSSKKLKSTQKISSQKLKSSYRSSEHFDKSQTSLALQCKAHGLGSLMFKEALVNEYEVPIRESFSTPIKRNNGNRIREITATRYINNFIQQNRSEAKIQNKEEGKEQDSLLILKHLETKQQKSIIHKPKFETPSKKQISSIKSIKLEPQSGSELRFYFSGKLKKQFLKKKILIKKSTSLEVGMIANLQQEIITNSKSKYQLVLKIYITTLLPLSKISVSIKLPAWLECTSKGNTQKDDMNEQTQLISNFILELKYLKQKSIKINYAELPTLNVVCINRNEKREVLCEPLPIMINRFSIEKKLGEEELYQILGICRTLQGQRVHEKIGVNLTQLKHYFTNVLLFNLDIGQKLQLFAQKDGVISDSLAAIKLQFILSHKEMCLLFFQATQSHSQGARLFVQFFPCRKEEWNYEQLHLFQCCLLSILCDK